MVAYLSFLLEINESSPLILELYIEYKLGSMGTKGGIILYHIGYGGCHVISVVTGCYQPRCWLISVEWVTKPSCDQICGTSTPTYIARVLITIGGREVYEFS